MLTLDRIDDLKDRPGEQLGVSDWDDVTQPGIDAFADATRDHHWIDTDPQRARATPFGATLALTLMFERAGGRKPACVAQTLYRVFEETT